MKRIILLTSLVLSGTFFAQKKKTSLNNWQNKDTETATKIFSRYGEKSKSAEEIKKELTKSQKIVKIEIINEGDWDQLKEISWFRFVKVNDGNFDQIINSDNLDLIANSSHTNNWKDENGNVSFRSVSEPLKISQEFNGKKNEKGQLSTPLTETEIYETTSPIFSFSFQIYTHRKDDNPAISTDLSKTINIYADNKLIKTFNYAYADLRKVSGISLKNFNVNEVK